MSFMFGGHETNSRALASIMLYLKRYPDWEKQIWQEIQEVVLDNGRIDEKLYRDRLTGDVLEKCSKTGYFVKEILWMAPPAAWSLGYIAMRDHTMKDGF